MRFVIDASTAFKWFIPEVLSDAAESLLKSEQQMIAPDFMLIEISNIFWKKIKRGEMTELECENALYYMTQGPISYFRTDSSLLFHAMHIANRMDHPIYDCIYLALAEQQAASVVTADKKFCEQAVNQKWKDKLIWLGEVENFL